MGRPRLNLIGKEYDRLTVLEEVKPRNGQRRFKCKCNCEKGNIITASYSNLESGNTRSCGCLRKEKPHKGNKYVPLADNRVVVLNADISDERIAETFGSLDFENDIDEINHLINHRLPYITILTEEQVELCKNYTITHSKQNNTCLINVDGELILLHRYLNECPSGLMVDHIEHNRRDNRSRKLRNCTHAENTKNSMLFANSVLGEAWRHDNELRSRGYEKEDMLPALIEDIPKETMKKYKYIRSLCTTETDPSKWQDDYRKYKKVSDGWNVTYDNYADMVSFIKDNKELSSPRLYDRWIQKAGDDSEKDRELTVRLYNNILEALDIDTDNDLEVS